MYDSIVEKGIIIDGTGRSRFSADIGIQDGRIVEISDTITESSETVIDARGLVVSPGFIDIHTHSDYTILINPRAESYVRQGVTTEVVGNCGVSCAPVKPGREDLLENYIFGEAEINWHTEKEYLDFIEKRGIAQNIISLVGHGTLRIAVMGFEPREATDDEVNEMKELMSKSMEEGAYGVSTGLGYAPGDNSNTEEVVEICKVVADYGGIYTTHLRNYNIEIINAAKEALEIASLAGVNTLISHYKCCYPTVSSKATNASELLALVNDAKRRGINVSWDLTVPIVHEGWNWGIAKLVSFLPSWSFEGGTEQLLKRLVDRDTRKKIMDHEGGRKAYVGRGWDSADRVILENCTNCKEYLGMKFDEIAEMEGIDSSEVIFRIAEREKEKFEGVKVNIALSPAEHTYEILKDPNTMLESDGFALAPYGQLAEVQGGQRSYGAFPTLFQQIVREDKLLTLEDAVKRITSLPAKTLGVEDRGVLKEGNWADITIFDHKKIMNRSTLKEPNQYPSGIPYVLINGERVIKKGEHTKELPGRVLRGPQRIKKG
jgi:N-acyl-D-amino-acid deacylase